MIFSLHDSTAVTDLVRQYLFRKPGSQVSPTAVAYRHSRASRLPREILSNIFLCYVHTPQRNSGDLMPRVCYDSKTQASPIVLAHVCSSWRFVAFSTKHLWSSLHVTGPTPGQLPLVELWLELSKNAPLSLSFKYQPPVTHLELRHVVTFGDPLESQSIAQELLSLFVERSARWREIDIQLMIPGSLPDMSLRDPLADLKDVGPPSLESISFDIDWKEIWSCAYRNPSLRNVHFHPSQSLDQHRDICWERLTTLRCDKITEDHYWFIIFNCQSLHSLHVEFHPFPDDPYRAQLWYSPVPAELPRIALLRLREFTVEFNCDPFSSIFQHIRLPSLRKLSVRQKDQSYTTVPDDMPTRFCHLLARSGCPLKELEMADYLVSTHMITALGTMPHLRNLSDLELECANDAEVQRLTLSTYDFFPDLRRLKITYCVTFGDSLSAMLRSRIHCLQEAEFQLSENSKIDAMPPDIWFLSPKIKVYDRHGICVPTRQPRPTPCDYCAVSYVPKDGYTGVFAYSY